MSNYFKSLTVDNIRYHDGLKKGVNVYAGVPAEENLLQLDKYIFKNGDLMGEIQQESFPFKLTKDCCFSILSVKGENVNYIVEREAEQTYFVKYITKDFGFVFVNSHFIIKK